jgi:hypothetical protein
MKATRPINIPKATPDKMIRLPVPSKDGAEIKVTTYAIYISANKTN